MQATSDHGFPLGGARLVLFGLLGAAVLSAGASRVGAESPATELGAEIGDFGVDLGDRDLSVPPGDDFFRYSCGTWLATFEIPEDLAGYGSFTKLHIRSEEQIRDIIQDAAKTDAEKGSVAQKVGDLFNDFLDVEALDAKGLAPLQPMFDKVDAVKTHEDAAMLLAELDWVDGGGWGGGGTSPFAYYIDQDPKDPTQYIPTFNQSGLGLPNRDYYLDADNPRFVEAKKVYREYLEKMLRIAGVEDPGARADDILAMETGLAEAHWPAEDTRDIDKTYNKMTVAEIEKTAPDFPWSAYMKALGIKNQDVYIVSEPSAFAGMTKVFQETPVEVWRDFMKYRLLRTNAAYLPREVDDTQFEFTSKAITGTKEQRERWKRGVQFVNGSMGEAVGQLYVERYFNPTAKARIDELVDNLLKAMAVRIKNLDWMEEATKTQALDKLSKFAVKIGYPDKWKDYSSLEVIPGDLLGNAMRARKFAYEYNLNKLGKPVDRDEWFMPPQTVNAYYNSGMNEIVFPAAILQPPFFDPYADDAVNYGGIGAVIGHEIGHGFDDQGRKSDGDGVLRDWWTETDAEKFKERADALVAQYDAFSPLEGMHVNGELTLGENIGDLGGLEIAHYAYKLSLNGEEPPVIDGLTGDQRLFLGFAQIWKGKLRDALLTQLIASNPHSPNEFRVNGPLPNIDAWYEAWDVGPDNAMYMPPEKRVHIW